MFFIIGISIFVLLLLFSSIRCNYFKYFTHSSLIEIIWTSIPAIILIIIGYPSLKLLYNMEEIFIYDRTIKCLGHQWYWKYEENSDFDSYMINSNELYFGDHRLLNVDNFLSINLNSPTRLIVSGNDVIHSFSIPCLGVKIDGIPGKLNQSFINIDRVGVYYGQCSEICGAEHSFMPIKLKTIKN